MKWNKLFSLFFYEETAETTIWWNVNINLQSVHFYDQSPKSKTNEQQVQVFMSLTSVSNISQLKIKKILEPAAATTWNSSKKFFKKSKIPEI